MATKLPTVEEVEALIKAEDAIIGAAQERRRVLNKHLRLAREMSQITEPNAGTTERIVETDVEQG